MLKRNASIFSQVLIAAVLGLGLTACNSPEQQDAEVQEEPAASADVEESTTTAQDRVQADVVEGEADDVDSMPTNDLENEDTDLALPDADGIDTASSDEAGDIDVNEYQLDTPNDNVVDGTEQEEHVSTY